MQYIQSSYMNEYTIISRTQPTFRQTVWSRGKIKHRTAWNCFFFFLIIIIILITFFKNKSLDFLHRKITRAKKEIKEPNGYQRLVNVKKKIKLLITDIINIYYKLVSFKFGVLYCKIFESRYFFSKVIQVLIVKTLEVLKKQKNMVAGRYD